MNTATEFAVNEGINFLHSLKKDDLNRLVEQAAAFVVAKVAASETSVDNNLTEKIAPLGVKFFQELAKPPTPAQ